MATSLLIIGGGIAGLSAGCYARMNGFETTVLEQHTVPGGLCTAWKRGDYWFDGCLHWLVGTSPHSGFHLLWEELGVLKDTRIIDHEEFGRIVGVNGQTLILYTNADRLEEHLLTLAPRDARLIREMTAAVRQLQALDMPVGKPMELYSPVEKLSFFWQMRGVLGPLLRYSKVTITQFTQRFTDPFVREALLAFFNLPEAPVISFLATLAWMHAHNAGYLEGGSLPLARRIEQRYRDLGGEMRYQALVEKILVENGRAVGVRLADGSELRADYVISAADGHATIFDMLDGKYLDARRREVYETWPVFPPLVQVSLGLARDLSGMAPTTTWMLPEPLVIAGAAHHRLSMHHYCYDPTMAPPGKSVAIAAFPTDYPYWKALAQDKAKYKDEKEAIARAVIAVLEQRLPGLTAQVEQVDVATPMTYERYTRNWQASFEGWLPTLRTGFSGLSKTLPELDHFFMIGQWVQPGGGLPPAAQHGRDVIYLICRQENRQFTATKV